MHLSAPSRVILGPGDPQHPRRRWSDRRADGLGHPARLDQPRSRLGLLVVLACLFGWLTIMGLVWWMYGIGMKGEAPDWRSGGRLRRPELRRCPGEEPADARRPQCEICRPPRRFKKATPKTRVITDRSGCRVDSTTATQFNHGATSSAAGASSSTPTRRGEAKATADRRRGPDGKNSSPTTAETTRPSTPSRGAASAALPEAPSATAWSHLRLRAEEDASCCAVLPPAHYAIIQVQPVIPQETPAGQAPPDAGGRRDPAGDLGDHEAQPRRCALPVVMVTMVSSGPDLRSIHMLHRCDRAGKLRLAHRPAVRRGGRARWASTSRS